MGLDNPLHIAFLLVILLLVFGAKRLPEMGRSLGEGLRGFKDAIGGEGSSLTSLGASAHTTNVTAQPQAAQPHAAQTQAALPQAPAIVAAPGTTTIAAPAPSDHQGDPQLVAAARTLGAQKLAAPTVGDRSQ